MIDEKTALFKKQVPYLYGEGVASNVMDALTTGTLLTGMALLLGASPLVVGILGSLSFFANVLQIPAIFLVEKYRNRQRIVLYSCWVARSSLLGVALLYFIPSQSLALVLFLFLCGLRFMGGAVAGCAWNSWMNDLIPKQRLGRFFGWRMILTTIAGTLVIYLASLFLERWETKHTPANITPYAILFTLSFVFGVFSNMMITRLYHPEIRKPSPDRFTSHFTLKDLRMPLQHHNFRLLIVFMSLWCFSVNLAAPFFTVFMVQSLNYSISEVIRFTVITQIVYVFTLRIWSHYSDRFSNKVIIGVCGPLFALCFLGWTFSTFPDPHAFTWSLILILHIVMGAATSGINLATNNIALKLCPDDHPTSFLAVNSLFSSVSAGIAPLIGGTLIGWVSDVQLNVNLQLIAEDSVTVWPTLALAGWDFFFFCAFLLAFFSLAFLFRLQEEGDIHRRILLKTLVFDSARFIQNISTVAGLRAQTSMPRPDNTKL